MLSNNKVAPPLTRLDAQIKLTVTAPLGERFLPTPALASWGVRSAPAFNLLLLCAGAWCEGVEIYESDVGEYCHPTSLTTNRAQLRSRGRRVLAALVDAGLLVVKDGILERDAAYYGSVEAGPLPIVASPKGSEPRRGPQRGLDVRLRMRLAGEFEGRDWQRAYNIGAH